MIINADILEWAASYDGPLFHALLCDPPYHLTEIVKRFGKPGSAPAQPGTDGAFQRASKGFMGRSWDGGDLAFQPETWRALANLLHPGAFLMAFAGSRGYHRMACAIEDAGLIIHPAIGWVFGCLSEDTEILTSNGWERYHKAIANSTVMCYNSDIDALEWHCVQELVAYDYNETAYRIHSANTDQIVSRNHRCLVERDGRWVFEYAENLGATERIPITTETQIQATPPISSRVANGQGDNLSDLWYAGIQAHGMAQKGSRYTDMWECLPGDRAVARPFDTRASQKNQQQQQRHQKSEEGQPWRAQSSMERRGNLFQDARQLHQREVCALPNRVHQHGSQGWLCDGAPAIRGTSDRAMPVAGRSGTPQRSQPSQQRPGEFATVRQQPRSQALRASRVAIPDLATVTPVHYRGVVWCVRVPTGAFVARRNGKIFITGNSGFPKATRLDTAIDRRAGAERQTVSTRKLTGNAAYKEGDPSLYQSIASRHPTRGTKEIDVTAPATELAQAWQGHRYGLQAMKPAFEFICVAQKAYEGKPAECITRTGAGALNIDGSRIGTGDDKGWDIGAEHIGAETTDGIYGSGFQRAAADRELGRWPSNLLLQHSEACNGACAPDCPVRRLGEQSGETVSIPRRSEDIDTPGATYSLGRTGTTERGHTDSGTAARYFFQADYMYERLEAADPLFYCSKADRAEREAGLDPRQIALLGMEEIDAGSRPDGSMFGFEGRSFRDGQWVNVKYPESTINDGRQKSIDNPYQRGETTRRSTGFDSIEIVMVKLSHNNETALGSETWANADQEVMLRVDTAQSPPRVTDVSTTQYGDAIQWNMLLFGNNTTAPYLADIKFTIKTKTSSITESKTLNWLMRLLTNESTADANSDLMDGGSLAENAENSSPSITFINNEAIQVLGVGNVAVRTLWTISANAKLEIGRDPFPLTRRTDGRQTEHETGHLRTSPRRNSHPCIKPLSLCRYLATLLLPPALYAPRRLLVPFCGAASEYIGGILAGWEEIVGIEIEADYCRIGEARAAYWRQRRHEFLDPSKPIEAKVSAAPPGQRDMFLEDL